VCRHGHELEYDNEFDMVIDGVCGPEVFPDAVAGGLKGRWAKEPKGQRAEGPKALRGAGAGSQVIATSQLEMEVR
jgi:hypothetical protein